MMRQSKRVVEWNRTRKRSVVCAVRGFSPKASSFGASPSRPD